MTTIKLIIRIVVVVLLVGALFRAMDKQDAKREESVRQYETCVMCDTGMTPARYYNQFGFYPECGNDNK